MASLNGNFIWRVRLAGQVGSFIQELKQENIVKQMK
jgi:hypothetical protein